MATATRSAPTLGAYAALVRVPNLFTAPPDVVVGAALASVVWGVVDPLAVAGLALASVLLYAGGTTLNDYVDAAEDARERPTRPIPSGAVSRPMAGGLAAALLLAGVLVAAGAAGAVGFAVAALLAAVVVAYDWLLNGTTSGFLAMGVARGLNVCLGAAAVGATLDPATVLATVQGAVATPAAVLFVAPLVTVLYIASVTRMAAEETRGRNRRGVRLAAVGAGFAALAAPLLVGLVAGATAALLAGTLAVGFVVWVGRPLRRAYERPRPDTVGPAVGACVLGLVVFDAALALVAGPLWALVVLTHLIPARLLASTFAVS